MRPKVIVLEGHRLTGKSTVARILRESINYVTLVNPTGFPDKGEEGLRRITDYYESWIELIKSDTSGNTFIFDRFFFSELVFSTLYKDYDFKPTAQRMLRELFEYSDLSMYILRVDSNATLEERQGRNKVEFAGVADSENEIFKQRAEYDKLIDFMQDTLGPWEFSCIPIQKINTDGCTPQWVADFIILHHELSLELDGSKKP